MHQNQNQNTLELTADQVRTLYGAFQPGDPGLQGQH